MEKLVTAMAAAVLLLGLEACERAAPPRAAKTTTAPAPASPWYEDLSLTQASDKAAAENKLLFLVLYAVDSPTFGGLERTVLEDARARRLLSRHTVAIKVAAEDNPLLAARYGFEGLPTFLFLRPDGTEVDRVVGHPDVRGFLEEAADYAVGRDRVTLALESTIDAHVRLAGALVQKEKFREALAEYQWALEHCAGSAELFENKGTAVVQGLAGLAYMYVPARSVLEDHYEAAHDRLVAGPVKAVDLRTIITFNRLRGQPGETLAIYDRIRSDCADAETLAAWTQMVFDSLLAARRYEDIAAAIDVPQEIEELLEDAQDKPRREDYENEREFRHALHAYQERLREPAIAYYQVLIGLERYEAADELAARLLEQAGGCRVYNALAWAGYLTGHPTEANLAQARKAYECSHGDSAVVTDTLARVLAARGQRDEALQLLADSLERTNNENDRSVLEQCRSDIEAQR